MKRSGVASAVGDAKRQRQRSTAGYGGTDSGSSSDDDTASVSFHSVKPRRVAQRKAPRKIDAGILRRIRRKEHPEDEVQLEETVIPSDTTST